MITPVEGSDGRESSVESGPSSAYLPANIAPSIVAKAAKENTGGFAAAPAGVSAVSVAAAAPIDISGLGAYMRTTGIDWASV